MRKQEPVMPGSERVLELLQLGGQFDGLDRLWGEFRYVSSPLDGDSIAVQSILANPPRGVIHGFEHLPCDLQRIVSTAKVHRSCRSAQSFEDVSNLALLQ